MPGLRNISLSARPAFIADLANYPMSTKENDILRSSKRFDLSPSNLKNLSGKKTIGLPRTQSKQSLTGNNSPKNEDFQEVSKHMILSNKDLLIHQHQQKNTLRKLPNSVEAVEVDNMPSDISDDEWGEV